MLLRILFLFILSCGFADADVYKWIDEKGNVHYGDKPLQTESAKQLNVDTSSSTGIGGSNEDRDEKRQKLLDALEEDRKDRNKEKQALAKKKKRDRLLCSRHKDRLKNHQRATGVYHLDKDGNRAYFSNSQRAQSENRIRANIRKYCR